MSDQELSPELRVLLEVKQSLGGLHEKADSQAEAFKAHTAEDAEALRRIASLEESRAKVVGSHWVIVAAVSIVSSLLTLLARALAAK